MRPIVEPIFRSLTAETDRKVRAALARRYDAMEREFKYIDEKDDHNLLLIRRHGWTDERLLVLFLLNSFYQQVLGPLQSSARGGTAKLGTIVPIKHGGTLYDAARSTRINSTANAFFALAEKLDFERAWMTKNTAGDLIFTIARHEEERAGERGGN